MPAMPADCSRTSLSIQPAFAARSSKASELAIHFASCHFHVASVQLLSREQVNRLLLDKLVWLLGWELELIQLSLCSACCFEIRLA